MALPATYSLALYRGDSFRMQFRLWADAAKTQPVDLTGATVAAEIRGAPSSLPWHAFSCSIASNIIDIAMTADQTAGLPANAYWDLQVAYASGDVQTIVMGGVSVRGNITSSTIGTQELAHV